MPFDRLQGLRNDRSRKHRDTVEARVPRPSRRGGARGPRERGALPYTCPPPGLLGLQGAPFLGPGGSEVAGGRGAGAGQTGLGIGRGEVGSSDLVRS